jgi:hypothetical protein
MSAPISTVQKNSFQEIRVELSEFRGYDFINLRIWAKPRDGGSERIPTKAAIAWKVALLPDLIAALQKAEAEARRLGFLP